MFRRNRIQVIAGGIPILFYSDQPETLFLPSRDYQDFHTRVTPEVQIKVSTSPDLPQGLGESIFQYHTWSLHQVDGRKVIQTLHPEPNLHHCISTLSLFPGEDQAELCFRVQPGTVGLPSQVAIPPFGLDGVMTVFLLADRRGIMLHACGLQTRSGTGLVFSGDSGSGKSTTATLWHEHTDAVILGDERIAIRKQGGQFLAYGTPWTGDLGIAHPGPARLDKLFILKHALENSTRLLSPAEAVANLLPRAYLPFWDSTGMAFCLEFLEDLCTQLPCYEFGFTPDLHAVEHVRWLIAS
jgi:hypothetical protein